MRSARYDQFEFPDSRFIFECVVLASAPILLVVLLNVFAGEWIFLDNFTIPVLILVSPVFLYLLYKKMKDYNAAYQARRDQAALKLFNATSSGEVEKFAVFLRPFYTTDKVGQTELVQELTVSTDGSTTQRTIPIHHPLEEAIVEALREAMQVVALGKPGETRGVGRILVDDVSWQSVASKLMGRALLLICVPSSRPGTRWELKEIIETHYLRKTVFVMPPDELLWGWKEIRDDWVLVSQQMASYGIAIPQYDNDGLLFSVNAKGQCTTEKLCLDSAQGLQAAFTRLSSSAKAVDESETTIAKRAISVPISHAPISQSWIKRLTQSWNAAARH